MSVSENCDHDCASCGESCSSRTAAAIQKEKLNELSTVRKVFGIVSGKGGVGKSVITSLLTCAMQKKGFQTAILDADITGPSIPKMFGIHTRAQADGHGIYPEMSEGGTQIMSSNLLLENETDPVIWRGPVIAGLVKQFWSDVIWNDVDYMFVDMPPGTGDVPLTVFQSIPVDGIIIAASPQELVGMIVAKAVRMAYEMKVPVLGIVENMSYFECPNCGEKHFIYGDSHVEDFAAQYCIDNVARIPIDPSIAAMCDAGQVEKIEGNWLDELADALVNFTGNAD